MPVFDFCAMSSSGQEVKDTVEAANADEAIAKIRVRGMFPTKVRERKSRDGLLDLTRESNEKPLDLKAELPAAQASSLFSNSEMEEMKEMLVAAAAVAKAQAGPLIQTVEAFLDAASASQLCPKIAKLSRQMFVEFTKAGFDDEQAMRLVTGAMSGLGKQGK